MSLIALQMVSDRGILSLLGQSLTPYPLVPVYPFNSSIDVGLFLFSPLSALTRVQLLVAGPSAWRLCASVRRRIVEPLVIEMYGFAWNHDNTDNANHAQMLLTDMNFIYPVCHSRSHFGTYRIFTFIQAGYPK
jgi:hypothetical protein